MTDDVSIVVGITGDTSGGRVIKKSLDDIATSGDKAINSTARFQKALSSVQSASVSLTGALTGLLGAFGLRELARISDQYTMISARLKNITGSVGEANIAMRQLQRISAETGTSIEASLDIMQRLSFVREEIHATNQDMLTFTETVSKLGVMSGASSDALKFGLTQLGQSLSSQIMRAEEFNSIMENIPGVGKAIADQFGVTTGQLRQLVVNGKVLSSDVFAAILNQANEVNAKMAEMPMTIERAGKQAGITFDTLVAKVMSTTDASQGYVKIIEFGNDRLKEMVATVDIIRQSFEFAGNRIAVTFNNIAYEIQQIYNQAITAIYDISGGRFGASSKPGLLSAGPNVKSEFFKMDYSQTIDQFNTSKSNAVRSATGDQYGPFKPQESRAISQNYADIASKLATTTKLTKEQRDALKAQKKIQDELKDAVKESRSETEKLYDKIKEQEALKPFAKTQEQADAIAKNIKNAQNELEKLRVKAELESPVGKAFQSLAKEIDDDFKDAFKSAFTQSDGGFKKLLEGWKNAFKNFLADLAYQAAVRPILVSLVGGVGSALGLSNNAVASVLGTSGGTAGSGGGIGSLLSTGSSLFSAAGNLLSGGTSSLLTSGVNRLGNFLGIGGVGANGPVSLSSYSSFTNGSFGGTLGAGLASFGGNMLANAIFGGNRGIGSTIGGTIGGIAGSFLPVPILGPLAGSFIGNALGGLFGGGKPTDGTQGGGINLATGDIFGLNGMGGKKYSAANASFRDSVLGEASNLVKLLQSVGGTTSGRIDVAIGSRDGLRLNTYDENGARNFGMNSQAFVEAIMQAIVKGTTGLTSTFKTILDKVGVSDTKKLADAFEFGKQFDEFVNQTTQTPVDVLNDTLKALNDNLANLQQQATELGLPTDKLTESYNKQKDALMNSIKAQMAGYQSLDDMNRAFDNFFNGQALSSNSSLTPMQKLQTAQSVFGDLLTKAQGGDLSVTPDLLNAANSLIDQGRDVYASGVDFSNLEGFVRSSVQGIANQAGYSGQNVAYSIVSTNQQLVQQGNDQTQAIQDMKSEIYRLSNKISALTDKVA